MDPSSPLVSVTSMFFLKSERLDVLLYHVFPPILLSPETATSSDLCGHAIIILLRQFSSYLLITWPCRLNLASRILSIIHATPSVYYLMISFLFLSFSETPSIHCCTAAFSVQFSPVTLSISVTLSRPRLHISALVVWLSCIHIALDINVKISASKVLYREMDKALGQSRTLCITLHCK